MHRRRKLHKSHNSPTLFALAVGGGNANNLKPSFRCSSVAPPAMVSVQKPEPAHDFTLVVLELVRTTEYLGNGRPLGVVGREVVLVSQLQCCRSSARVDLHLAPIWPMVRFDLDRRASRKSAHPRISFELLAPSREGRDMTAAPPAGATDHAPEQAARFAWLHCRIMWF